MTQHEEGSLPYAQCDALVGDYPDTRRCNKTVKRDRNAAFQRCADHPVKAVWPADESFTDPRGEHEPEQQPQVDADGFTVIKP